MSDEKRTQAIGLFDSGLGGLTVMRQVMRLLPHEDLVYFGDTARLPYGEKSPETISRYAIENAIFLIEQGVKLLIVSCNTASAHALDRLRQIFNIPILGVIEPSVEKAVSLTRKQKIAVLGTRGTIQSGAYQQKIKSHLPCAEVFAIACPLLAPLVEEKLWQHAATRLIIKEYLAPLKEQEIDVALLGCTHYPLIKESIQEEAGEKIAVIDSAAACAESARNLLEKHALSNRQGRLGKRSYFVSDDAEKFRRLGSSFLGEEIPEVGLARLNLF